MRLAFADLHITKVTPDGLSFFTFTDNGEEMSGFTNVPDAGSKKSFCAVIFKDDIKQGCTIFITRPVSVQCGKQGIMI